MKSFLFDDGAASYRLKALLSVVMLLTVNLAVWLCAWALFHDSPTLLATALLAWVFGLRHAVDADHIAAIDNVVRTLMQEGKRPLGVGFFFSLGHSSVVVLASVAIAATAHLFRDDLEAFRDIGGVIGTSVSSLFLILIGVANLFVLRGVWDAFQRARHHQSVEEESLNILLAGRGFLARLFRPLFALITRSWHMYPLGFLFGLGFDTATEVGLLGISASQASQGMSPWMIMIFPALFAAGMALIDTLDSIAMVGAYGWAFVHPIRKLWYNLTITAASVMVALLIGGVEALGLISDKLGLQGDFWQSVSSLNDNFSDLGFIIIGVFMAAWLVSALIYKFKRYDDMPYRLESSAT
jgi:nickel/cobalt transporter (NiCoT) family protein